MKSNLIDKLNKLDPLLDIVNDPEIDSLAAFLGERIENPESYVVMLGETSSGKSTLINGLLGTKVLPTGSIPTTGAITEVVISQEKKTPVFQKITKQAEIYPCSQSEMSALAMQQDDSIMRLRVQAACHYSELNGMRLFDTPGYGSLIEKHDEILKEFIPNSDVVVYVISYRIGLQEADAKFISLLKELVSETADIIVVINRCPSMVSESDPRIKEIKQYAIALLNDQCSFAYVNAIPANDGIPILPKSEMLWKKTAAILQSDKRQAALSDALESYIIELYDRCDTIIRSRLEYALLDETQRKELIQTQKKYAAKLRKAISNLIEPTFRRIVQQFPAKFKEAAKEISDGLCCEIDESRATEKDQLVVYIEQHAIPHQIANSTKEISEYVQTELTHLNSLVEDYIETCLTEFDNELKLKFDNIWAQLGKGAGRSAAKGLAKQAGGKGLLAYFAKIGGRGGSNLGAYNAAAKLMKNIGKLFGKKFTIQQYAKMKHTMKVVLDKLGVSAGRAATNALGILIEAAIWAWDLATWKKELKKATKKHLEEWGEHGYEGILPDIEELKQSNIDLINELADKAESLYEDSQVDYDIDQLKRNDMLSKSIGKELKPNA